MEQTLATEVLALLTGLGVGWLADHLRWRRAIVVATATLLVVLVNVGLFVQNAGVVTPLMRFFLFLPGVLLAQDLRCLGRNSGSARDAAQEKRG